MMQFRLRISTPDDFIDLVLPEGVFIVGRKPQSTPNITFATVAYLLENHLRFDTSRDSCIVSLQTHPLPEHETTYKGKPFEQGMQSLNDGDWLDIFDQKNKHLSITIVVETIVMRETNPFAAATPGSRPFQELPPGLPGYSTHFLPLLPEIYQPTVALADMYGNHSAATFLARLLALLESEFLPLQWTATNFDLFLDPRTTPNFFLSWLENWLYLGDAWDEQARRSVLATYAWRGTRFGLKRLLEIYTGCTPNIQDSQADDPQLAAGSFKVILPFTQQEGEKRQINFDKIKLLIDGFKPVHTTFTLYDANGQQQ